MADEEKKEEGVQETVDTAKEAVETVDESVKEATEEAAVEMTAAQKKIVEQIEKMTVLELNEFVKVLEQKFGVSAQAVAVAAPGAGAEGAGEEQTAFTVELTDGGTQKIAVIKVVKEVLGLGLKDAKDMVDGVPTALKEGVKKEEAEEIQKKIEEAGGKVMLK